MGKKATLFLLYGLSIVLTIIISVLTVVCMHAGSFAPSSHPIIALGALALPLLVVINIFLFLYWLIRRNWIVCLIPLAALLLGYNYYQTFYKKGQAVNLTQRQQANNLRIMTYNIQRFINRQPIKSAAALAQMLKEEDIDIACFQEYGEPEKFSDTISKVFKQYPYRFTNLHLNNQTDISILSRFPIIDINYTEFPFSKYGFLRAEIALCNNDTLTTNTKKITVFITHLQTTGVSSANSVIKTAQEHGQNLGNIYKAERIGSGILTSFKMREEQIAIINSAIEKETNPVILCGDFNDTPVSYAVAQAQKYLTDGWAECGKGYIYSYRYFKKLLKIDYILHSEAFKSVKYYSPDKQWSDHNPIVSELTWSSQQKN